jgi:hypothetical protein
VIHDKSGSSRANLVDWEKKGRTIIAEVHRRMMLAVAGTPIAQCGPDADDCEKEHDLWLELNS